MLIATNNQVFALENGTPTQRLAIDGIRCLDEGARCSAIGLADGQVVVLANGQAQPQATGIGDPVECIALLSEEPLQVLLGTEPPHVYCLDGDEPARRMESFDTLECRQSWYTPWGGPPAVRSLAHSGDWVFADIHVGSIMRSPDRGATWEPVTPDLHADVHQVATASTEGRLYANTADAVFASDDYGHSWEHRKEGLASRYGRALAVHPARSRLPAGQRQQRAWSWQRCAGQALLFARRGPHLDPGVHRLPRGQGQYRHLPHRL